MDTAQVEADLKARIEQSREWVANNPEPVKELKFRNYSAAAKPAVFLDNEKRVERYGVGFDFALLQAPKPLGVRLNVRIKPEASVTENGDSPPYVAIYVLNQETGADEAITWHHFTVANGYRDLVSIAIDDWYRKWLNAALVNKRASKILHAEMQASEVT
jgi:hypothetical protein